MGRQAVDALLYLLDEAFEGNEEHSLLANLRSVPEEDWLKAPEGGSRSVFDIAQHVGECKYVYHNHAFGDGSMRWDRPGTVPSLGPSTPAAAAIDWLREGQRLLRKAVAALDDEGLSVRRRVNWGETAETRWIVSVMIEHDLYHAGEINHLRSLNQGDDRWAWQRGPDMSPASGDS